MAQVKVFGLRDELGTNRAELSEIIHSCVVDALQYPADKRFHRFFPLDRDDFVHPDNRSDRLLFERIYLIIEILMFEGRSSESKSDLIRLLFERIGRDLQIPPQDVEITILESPMHRDNWGIRGRIATELELSYRVDV